MRRDTEWMSLVIIYYIFLTGIIGPEVYLLLDIAAPRANVLARVGACFIHRGWNEYLGVEWEVCLCLGFFFSWGGRGQGP